MKLTFDPEVIRERAVQASIAVYTKIFDPLQLERAIEKGPEEMAHYVRKCASLAKFMGLALTNELACIDMDIQEIADNFKSLSEE